MQLTEALNEVRFYFVNRFVTKLHVMNTNLPKGKFFELEDRMLHALFEGLVDFIEIEKAWMQVAFDPDAMKKYGYPKYFGKWWLRWGKFRCPEAGLDHLDWESKLVQNEDMGFKPDDEDYGHPCLQARAAIEQKTLYDWWKLVRPLRQNPYETISKETHGEGWWQIIHDMEERHFKEDTEMMTRLIKVRNSLWT